MWIHLPIPDLFYSFMVDNIIAAVICQRKNIIMIVTQTQVNCHMRFSFSLYFSFIHSFIFHLQLSLIFHLSSFSLLYIWQWVISPCLCGVSLHPHHYILHKFTQHTLHFYVFHCCSISLTCNIP